MKVVQYKSDVIMGLSVVPGDIIDVHLVAQDEDSGVALLLSIGKSDECSSMFLGKLYRGKYYVPVKKDAYVNISNVKARKIVQTF